ncbi:MAG: ABC transporter ATP-binding protein [Betaproteobacteria bacterium]|nr:ABC transporter ATP-binding protein [Betaproteobacteria bacterium]
MNRPAIEIENLSKTFRLYPDLVRSRLKQYLFFWNTYYREKVALDGINLRIDKGEVVGVLGPNGAGKSTLLKIIAGISYPTSGRVSVDGRVVAVLSLGLGFHPRLSGLENIELAGMMLGMTREEIRRKRDWIVEFSELKEYITQPMSAYSSGMRARLSFAVAACQEPEILIIDEALATGDIRFVQKCIGRILEITRSGATALFVSHSIWSIKRLTRRCILLANGKIADDGETAVVADRYYELMLQHEVFEPDGAASYASEFVGTGEVRLQRAELLDASGRSTRIVAPGDTVALALELVSRQNLDHVGMMVKCWRNDGINVMTMGYMAGGVLSENYEFRNTTLRLPAGTSTVRFKLPKLLLAPGDYYMSLSIFDEPTFSGSTSAEQYYFKQHVIEFGVRMLGNPNRGLVYYQPAAVALEGGKLPRNT